ncbi:MAG: alpha/beta fold hydrolase [Microlunatus sp.]
MPRRRFGRWTAVLAAAAISLTTPAPMLTPTAAAADPVDPLQATVETYLAKNGSLALGDCPTLREIGSECGTVVVPKDWQNPSKGDLRVAIAYLRSDNADAQLLTTNPGGPGVSGRYLTEQLSWSKPTLAEQYDLLGFDPRGYGASTRVQCLTTTAKYNKLPKVADRRVRNKATHAVEVAEAKLFGEACGSDPNARYINTQQTVWDLDFLRRLMAQYAGKTYDQLNYIGYSYGTWLGAWYADTFPTRVGRFIFDSNMDWTSSMYANQSLDPRAFQRRRDKMLFPYLARHHSDFGLGKSAKAVKKKYEATRKKLATQAKKALKKGRTPAFGPEDLDYTVAAYIELDSGFETAGAVIESAVYLAKHPSSSKARKSVAKRVKGAMTGAPFSVQRSAKAVSSAQKDISSGLAGSIVRCNDSANSSNVTALLKRADTATKKYPFQGYLNTLPLCAYWKYKPQTRTIDLAGVANKILMFQGEGDPATAYEGARTAHRRTATKTILVSVDNEGQHGLYIDGPSKCVDSLGDKFLFTSWRPTADSTCTTSPLPFDKKVYSLAGPVSAATSTAKTAVQAKNTAVSEVRAEVAKRSLS